MFSFKKVSQTVHRAVEFISNFGVTPAKSLRNALLECDEDKAMLIYTTPTKGKSLQEELHPSVAFVSNKSNEGNTPLHLAAYGAMEKILLLFLQNGGNPNALNTNKESSLHALCRRSDQDEVRCRLLVLLLQWRSQENGTEEQLSINAVDADGNTPAHYAAYYGLSATLALLVQNGAILSVVNRDQYTCCDMASINNHMTLADRLETCLVFQPDDISLQFLEGDIYRHENNTPLYVLDCRAASPEYLVSYRRQCVTAVVEKLGITAAKAEVLLDNSDWEVEKCIQRATKAKENEESKAVDAVQSPAETGSVCPICSEPMGAPLSLNSFNDKEQSMIEVQDGEPAPSLCCAAGHAFCITCYAHYTSIEITEHAATALTCMAYQCEEVHAIEYAPLYLPLEMQQRLTMNRSNRVIDRHPQFHNCPECTLPIYVASAPPIDGNTSVSVLCPKGHMLCLQCGSKGHCPCTCSAIEKWKLKIQHEMASAGHAEGGSSEAIANSLWVAANTKKCPKCRLPIEKNDGCNHMVCRKCRHEFCWICMQEWEQHSNRTGGFFQCNLIATSPRNPNGSGGDDDEGYGMSIEEMGGAAAETARMRQRGHRMEVFINMFTKYKAHTDSSDLERNMMGATISRLRNSLHRSVEDPINEWLQGESFMHPYMTCPAAADEKLELQCDVLRQNSREESKEDLDEPPLLFLLKGFRELLKCRQFLCCSYPFAYYNVSAAALLPWNHPEAYSRNALTASRQQLYEQMQGDLEILTETLSDVVARRRLRATRSHIIHATRAARSRRLEFEAFICNMVRNIEDEKARSASRAVTRSAPARLNRRPQQARSPMENINLSHRFRLEALGSDSDEDETPAAEDESRSMQRRSRGQPRSRQGHSTGERPLGRRSLRFTLDGDNDSGSPRLTYTTMTPAAAAGNLPSRDAAYTTPQQQRRRAQQERDEALRRALEESGIFSDEVRLDFEDDRDGREDQERLMILSAEEEDLNRAILLSLQTPVPPATASTTAAAMTSSSSNDTPAAAPTIWGNVAVTEENIAALESMGFERDRAEASLRANRNNVSRAAEALLNEI